MEFLILDFEGHSNTGLILQATHTSVKLLKQGM